MNEKIDSSPIEKIVKFFDFVLKTSKGHLLIIGKNGVIHFSNSGFNDFIGIKNRHPINIDIRELIDKNDIEKFQKEIINSRSKKFKKIKLKIGNIHIANIEYICYPILSDKGKILYYMMTTKELIENKLNFLYSGFQTPQRIIIFSLDLNYKYLSFNENHFQIMKLIWGKEIHIGSSIFDAIQRQDDRDKAKINFDRALSGESFTVIEQYGVEAQRRDYFENNYSPLTNNDGEVIGITVFVHDITTYKNTELVMNKLIKNYEAVHENSIDMIFNLDRDLIPVFMNKSTTVSLELNNNTSFIDLIHDADRDMVTEMIDRCFDGERIEGLVFRIRERSGNFLYIQLNASKIEIDEKSQLVGIARDVTLVKKIEYEQLRERNLESISYLAGGIAHDFNNILVSIIGNTSLLEIQDIMDDYAKDLINDVKIAANRAKDLASQLLTFSKGGDLLKRPRNLKEIILESINLAFSGMAVESVLEYDISSSTVVDLDRGQITNLFNNVYINAIQAMKNKGEIVTHVYSVSGDEVIMQGLPNKNYIAIEIKDEGPGIPDDITDKIFIPFFTTKDKGTGLGLSMSYNIALKHNGKLTFRTEIDKGTSFFLYLPLSNRKTVELPSSRKDKFMNLSGKILILEDDGSVMNTLTRMLTNLGIEYLVFDNGMDLINEYKGNISSYQLVILDLTIKGKGMGGKETYDRLSIINPKIRAIVSSGYSQDPIIANYARIGFKTVLQKPYTLNELSDAIENCIA